MYILILYKQIHCEYIPFFVDYLTSYYYDEIINFYIESKTKFVFSKFKKVVFIPFFFFDL